MNIDGRELNMVLITTNKKKVNPSVQKNEKLKFDFLEELKYILF